MTWINYKAQVAKVAIQSETWWNVEFVSWGARRMPFGQC